MSIICAMVLILLIGAPGLAQDCSDSFDSTFEMVQELIFERHGCTAAACHSGDNPSGGLDLSKDVAWENLFEVEPQTLPGNGLLRVTPNSKQTSLLWLNLASAVLPDLWEAPIRSMPLGGAAPLSLTELELLREWIENGAVREGLVPETVGLFDDVCLPPLEPLEAEPLAPPEEGKGIQLRAPRLALPPEFETEVCFTSYYDFTDVVPQESLTEDGKFFVARATGIADPLLVGYEPPLILGGKDTSAADRTLTYCGLYDNGFTDPDDVVRSSKRPTNAGPCVPTHCAEGLVGEPCSTDSQCDTSPGTGDGFCDACRSGFGLTTDDEMFLLIGSYIVPPGAD